jgi:hypothetical protein
LILIGLLWAVVKVGGILLKVVGYLHKGCAKYTKASLQSQTN